jgi:hypothetical protein
MGVKYDTPHKPMPTPQAQASNLSRTHFIAALLLLVYLLRNATPAARSAFAPDRGLDDFKSAKTDKPSAAPTFIAGKGGQDPPQFGQRKRSIPQPIE